MSLILKSDAIFNSKGAIPSVNHAPKKQKSKKSNGKPKGSKNRSKGNELAKVAVNKPKILSIEPSPDLRISQYVRTKEKHRKIGLGGEILFAKALKGIGLKRVTITSRIDDRTGYDISWLDSKTGRTSYAQVKTSTMLSPSLSSWRISASQIRAHQNAELDNHDFFYVFLYAYSPRAKLSDHEDSNSQRFRTLGFILKPEDILFHPHTIYTDIRTPPRERLVMDMNVLSSNSSETIKNLQTNYNGHAAKPDFATAIQAAATVMNHGLFMVAKYLQEEEQLGKIKNLEINYSRFSPHHPNFSFIEIPSGKRVIVEFKASTGRAPVYRDKDTLKTATSIKMTASRLEFINNFSNKYDQNTRFQIWKAYFTANNEMILDKYDFSRGINPEDQNISCRPWEYRITLRTGEEDHFQGSPKVGNFIITDNYDLIFREKIPIVKPPKLRTSSSTFRN